MTEALATPGALVTPGLARRLACFVYEGVLLFGVVVAAGLAYGLATQQRHALVGALGLRVVLFIVLGLYFVWFWTRSGQTLAMQTWRIRLVTRDGRPLTRLRALCRYLLAWLWFVPALVALKLTGLHGALPALAAIGAGVLAYAALAWLHPDRQYWHDAVCGTRLVAWLPPPRHATPR
ncbi:MAG: RDD family protein [Rubrivivax sp.]|nr:RDD family protein [Rubrivivax sp.]